LDNRVINNTDARCNHEDAPIEYILLHKWFCLVSPVAETVCMHSNRIKDEVSLAASQALNIHFVLSFSLSVTFRSSLFRYSVQNSISVSVLIHKCYMSSLFESP